MTRQILTVICFLVILAMPVLAEDKDIGKNRDTEKQPNQNQDEKLSLELRLGGYDLRDKDKGDFYGTPLTAGLGLTINTDNPDISWRISVDVTGSFLGGSDDSNYVDLNNWSENSTDGDVTIRELSGAIIWNNPAGQDSFANIFGHLYVGVGLGFYSAQGHTTIDNYGEIAGAPYTFYQSGTMKGTGLGLNEFIGIRLFKGSHIELKYNQVRLDMSGPLPVIREKDANYGGLNYIWAFEFAF
jgi:hypothetical protein